MDRYITLLGADDVRSAANNMYGAAGQMELAASSIHYTFEAHQRFLEDWLQRFQAAMQGVE